MWDQLVFHVEIDNLTTDTLLVAPEQFYSSLMGERLPSSLLPKQRAVDPESLYLALEQLKAQQAADDINTPLMQATETVLDLATEASGGNKKLTAQEQQSLDRERNQQHEQENTALALSRMSLNEKKHYFDNTLLRKTSLPPNTTIRGQVYFKYHKKADQIVIFLPLSDKPAFSFAFAHELVQQ